MRYPELFTDRLCITLPYKRMASLLTNYAVNNIEHFKPWSPPRPRNYYTIEYWTQRINDLLEEYDRGTSACFILRRRVDETSPMIGECNMTVIARGPFQSCFLGYNLDRCAVGQGYMREALRTVIAFAFNELRLHRIAASYMPTNERSGRVLRALGFTVEGYARDYLFLDGAWRDHILTSLLSPTMLEPFPAAPIPHAP
jgi:[ribosomal protein S5]-alanine N-acetyltransferase